MCVALAGLWAHPIFYFIKLLNGPSTFTPPAHTHWAESSTKFGGYIAKTISELVPRDCRWKCSWNVQILTCWLDSKVSETWGSWIWSAMTTMIRIYSTWPPIWRTSCCSNDSWRHSGFGGRPEGKWWNFILGLIHSKFSLLLLVSLM